MSWAEFKDFEINLTEATAAAGNSSQISAEYLPEGVTQIFYGGDRTAMYNGGQHGWQYAAFQFDVDGPVDIIIGGCQHSNVNATITDIEGSFSKELDTKTIGCGGVAIYKYTGKATTLKVYCGQYCPTIKVQSPTKESFEASWDWTQEPDALYKVINYSVGWLSADNGISMYVDASNGKLAENNGKAQFNANTRLLVPVYGADDEITVIGYPNGKTVMYTGFSVHGKEYTTDLKNYKVSAEDVKQGYIVITSTGDNKYLKTVTLKHTASASTPDVAFEDFKIDFRTNPYTVVVPTDGTLPACVTSFTGSFHDNQHGYQSSTITVSVDGPVKFTIGGCKHSNYIASVSVDGDDPIDIDTKTAGCANGFGAYTNYVVYRYNKETPATLTFELAEYCPYFIAEKCELVNDVKVSYYDTNGSLIGEETVEGNSALKFKYGAANVTVPSGEKFRGWYDASKKPVEEGVALTADIKLYAKTTPIEVATTTSTHTYDLTKANWYQNEHDLIEINNGAYYNNHGWDIATGGTIKLQVAGNALITVSRCAYGSGTTIVATDASNKEIATLDAKAASDGGEASFKYEGGATTLTLTFAKQTYLHGVSVEHIVPVAFKPFKINFRTNPYTVLAPEGGLPDNVSVTGGKFHNEGSSNEENRHGYQNVTMTVKTDRPVKFTISKCFYTDKATVSVDGGAPIEINTNSDGEDCDGQTSYDKYITYIYEGTGNAVLKFNLGQYCHYFFAEEWSGVKYDETTNTYMVAAGNANQLKDAISEANATGNVNIYLPNGIYDLGEDINTAINGNNIAIIGESRDGVIIKNTPAEEGLDKSATLKNVSTGLYLQDLTIQCNAPYNYSTTAERGVALWDKGTMTICKNVYLKGKQDTYYSNGAEGMKAYFEGGIIEGAVDFVCGSGNVLFNSVTFNVVKGTNAGNVIAAPSSYTSEFGYVFANCLVSGSINNGDYYLARAWKAHDDASSAATFYGTNFLKTPASGYWGETIGGTLTRRFGAFTITGNKLSMDAAYNVDLKKANLVNFAVDWDPAQIISQHKPIKTNGAGWASYTAFTDVVINGTDVKAYVARKINAKTVTLESIDGNKIPAGTPVFIYGANNSKYYVNSAIASSVSGKNYLKSVLFDTMLKNGSNAFVIGTRDGVCGLYLVNSNTLVPAGKCYLDATGYSLELAKNGLEIEILNAETTGIGNVGVDVDDDDARYNLAGQKVGKDYKGIVIRKDGKKYLAK